MTTIHYPVEDPSGLFSHVFTGPQYLQHLDQWIDIRLLFGHYDEVARLQSKRAQVAEFSKQ